MVEHEVNSKLDLPRGEDEEYQVFRSLMESLEKNENNSRVWRNNRK